MVAIVGWQKLFFPSGNLPFPMLFWYHISILTPKKDSHRWLLPIIPWHLKATESLLANMHLVISATCPLDWPMDTCIVMFARTVHLSILDQVSVTLDKWRVFTFHEPKLSVDLYVWYARQQAIYCSWTTKLYPKRVTWSEYYNALPQCTILWCIGSYTVSDSVKKMAISMTVTYRGRSVSKETLVFSSSKDMCSKRPILHRI